MSVRKKVGLTRCVWGMCFVVQHGCGLRTSSLTLWHAHRLILGQPLSTDNTTMSTFLSVARCLFRVQSFPQSCSRAWSVALPLSDSTGVTRTHLHCSDYCCGSFQGQKWHRTHKVDAAVKCSSISLQEVCLSLKTTFYLRTDTQEYGRKKIAWP